MSTRDYKTKNEILVVVDPDKVAKLKKPDDRKAPLPPPKTPKRFLPRRRTKTGVNFYDLGQVNIGGVWRDIDFSMLSSPGILDYTGFTAVGRFDTFDGVEKYHGLFRAKIFEEPRENWKNYYRKLTVDDGYKYGVEIRDTNIENFLYTRVYSVARPGERHRMDGLDITDDDWNINGLTVPEMPVFGLNCFQLFWSFDNDPAHFKITHGSYTDPAVEFELSPTADVFLMPMIVNTLWTYQANLSIPTADTLLGAYAPLSRQFWLDRELPGMPFGVFNYIRRDAFTPLTPELQAAAKAHILADLTPARMFHTHYIPPGIPVVDEVDPSGFTTSSTRPLQLGVDPFGNPPVRTYSTTNPGSLANGRLAGVILQGGEWFYFWTDNLWDGFEQNWFYPGHYGIYIGTEGF